MAKQGWSKGMSNSRPGDRYEKKKKGGGGSYSIVVRREGGETIIINPGRASFVF